ncbi:MAG: LysM peptidoglycan-binding domain-containing protein [Candidatus Promineifilaceae bacterium]|jgi:LysM repeat protein
MKRRILWLGLVLIGLTYLYRPSEAPIASAQSGSNLQIFNLVNDLRVRNGLPPFVWDQRLASAAQNQANFMATNNVYSHTGAGGSTPQSRASVAGFPGRATENVVGGTNLTPGQGVVWWINSPIHLNTLLAPQYSHVGIGTAQGFDQNFYALVAGSPTGYNAPAVPQVGDDNDQLLAPVAPVVIAEPREDGSIVHLVDSGQSFWVIAARYEIPLSQLYLYNNLNEESLITPGDELIIRLADGQEPPPTPTPPPFYTVREGESWWTIAAWHQLSVNDLLWLNSASEDSVLHAGDEVRIALLPGESPPPTPTPKLTHIVAAGETAWDISIRYGLPLDELINLNNLGPQAALSVGDELKIVTPTSTPTATVPPTETSVPTVTPTETPQNTPTPRPQATRLAVSPTATPTPEKNSLLASSGLGQVGLITSFGLLAVGLLAIIVVWRKAE